MNVAFLGKVGRITVDRLLLPLHRLAEIETLHILRVKKLDTPLAKATYSLLPNLPLPLTWLAMLWRGLRYLPGKNIDWIVSFNPVPWGFVAWLVAKILRKPIAMGLIGGDFYYHLTGKLGCFWRFVLRRCDAITVTGEYMREHLLAHGISAEIIHILPHSVDTDLFAPTGQDKKYDLVSVAELIHRKQVDVIVDALAILKQEFPDIKLAIAGTGPQKALLDEKIATLNLHDNVDFLGFVTDDSVILKDSRIVVVASLLEGLPIFLIEGMCCGGIPLCTNVGTISDWVKDGVNGFYFPTGDSTKLAELAGNLLRNHELYQATQKEVLKIRDHFHLDRATEVWHQIMVKD